MNSVSEKAELARKAVHNFCNGEATICVPPLDTDDDIILISIIDEWEKLRAENGRLREALELAIDWFNACIPEMDCRGDEDCDHCEAQNRTYIYRKALAGEGE